MTLLDRTLSVLAAYEHQLVREQMKPRLAASLMARIHTQEELEQIEQVKAWRREGLSLRVIQDLCKIRGVTTRSGKVPSIATLSRWTKCTAKPKRAKQSKSARQHLKSRSENRCFGLLEFIMDLREKGHSYREIAKRTQEAGYRTKEGNPLAHNQIARIVRRNNDPMTGGRDV